MKQSTNPEDQKLDELVKDLASINNQKESDDEAYEQIESKTNDNETVANFNGISDNMINSYLFNDNQLHNLIVDYFHTPLIADLKAGIKPTKSNYIGILEAMHNSQQQIKAAINDNLMVNVRLPSPVCLTTNKPLLIIDLDETLLHTVKGQNNYGNTISLTTQKIELVFTVILRPHVIEFLTVIKEYFTLVLFTASEKAYADQCIKLIDPKNDIFTMRLYKHSCLELGEVNDIKDLRIFRNVPLTDIIIVDNNPLCYLLQPGNAIPIKSFFAEPGDNELLKLTNILKFVANVKNKTQFLQSYFFKDAIVKIKHFKELVSLILADTQKTQ